MGSYSTFSRYDNYYFNGHFGVEGVPDPYRWNIGQNIIMMCTMALGDLLHPILGDFTFCTPNRSKDMKLQHFSHFFLPELF